MTDFTTVAKGFLIVDGRYLFGKTMLDYLESLIRYEKSKEQREYVRKLPEYIGKTLTDSSRKWVFY